eukprot:10126367-Karenia_brevis.AAC.1
MVMVMVMVMVMAWVVEHVWGHDSGQCGTSPSDVPHWPGWWNTCVPPVRPDMGAPRGQMMMIFDDDDGGD